MDYRSNHTLECLSGNYHSLDSGKQPLNLQRKMDIDDFIESELKKGKFAPPEEGDSTSSTKKPVLKLKNIKKGAQSSKPSSFYL
jgi:hypothetical protein